MKPRLSLKGRALQILAQRDHSRSELRRKLMAHASKPALGDEAALDDDAAAEQVDAVLDWLQANRYLNEERFAESRIHLRASRYGNLRIRQELAQHGMAIGAEAAQQLKDSEAARAREVWRRKFGCAPCDAAERARQMRFLAARGFSSEAIHQALRAPACDDEPA